MRKMTQPKFMASISVLTIAIVILLGNLQGDFLSADLRVSHRSSDQQAYELDKQRASDMAQAWNRLRAGLDDEHYIRLVCSSSSLTGDYRKFEITSLSAQGTLLTIQLRKLEDEDKKRGLSLRAREVSRLELLEKPW
jgi:hypothetical protein